MTDEQVREIVIVGGGTAGWMTAAALAKSFYKKGRRIRLVESDEIGTVGVGEATIPAIRTFNEVLGIDENAFVRATKGTFKLGIEFVNWGNIGEKYIHPFGVYGSPMADNIPFHHYWLKLRDAGYDRPLSSFSLAIAAAKRGRFSRPQNIPNSPLAQMAYAFQFDAGLYAKFLREFAEKREVQRIEGKVDSVALSQTDGSIESVTLASGQVIHGDLFIDCTGFRGLLIEEALQTGYEDWSHWLPCDRAVAVPCESNGPPIPYTRATAHTAGWQWRIPLQHRTGNGHVYCSKYMTDNEATNILLKNLDGKPIADPKPLRFKTGRRKAFWHKNCVAIGLSSGFLEPLESTSIHLIQTGITKLLSLFPDKRFSQSLVERYNKITAWEYERVRDFLILHYKVNQRTDSDFWIQCRNMPIPDELQNKLDLYITGGHIFRDNEELFGIPSWLAVMEGQNAHATGHHPLAESREAERLHQHLTKMQQVIAHCAESLPTHADFISRHCASESWPRNKMGE
ncbi:tryptophan 7-halogenase [Alteromonas sediminis]|uniref:Tryptophan 7-halogenase n=1 Tax=Alteromonas sediminis TaxID=2259342 RepID=A0A3N5Y4Q6_9ALTE|nr:tryptophan halogenase family protein [Alteromonas sediminis]RPJ68153.1 tryptophan 7-halogenase [Alteromonas sediminis]